LYKYLLDLQRTTAAVDTLLNDFLCSRSANGRDSTFTNTRGKRWSQVPKISAQILISFSYSRKSFAGTFLQLYKTPWRHTTLYSLVAYFSRLYLLPTYLDLKSLATGRQPNQSTDFHDVDANFVVFTSEEYYLGLHFARLGEMVQDSPHGVFGGRRSLFFRLRMTFLMRLGSLVSFPVHGFSQSTNWLAHC
jgi:hypothetical protein